MIVSPANAEAQLAQCQGGKRAMLTARDSRGVEKSNYHAYCTPLWIRGGSVRGLLGLRRETTSPHFVPSRSISALSGGKHGEPFLFHCSYLTKL